MTEPQFSLAYLTVVNTTAGDDVYGCKSGV